MQRLPFATQKLPSRAVISVAGEGAKDFLQNLVTADIDALGPGEATYSALLQPQGKILFDFFIFDTGDGLLLDCAASQLPELLKRLAMYRLRTKVAISAADGLEVGVAPDVPTEERRYADPRLASMGWRLFAPAGSLPPATGYHRARIAAGLADTDADLGSGEFFPHEANFDQIGAVSFTKGCYVGQEVVSRMEHRGLARSRILPIRCDGPSPPRGSDIRSGEKSVGTVLGSEGDAALALIRLDRLAEAGEPLLSGTVRVEVLKPAFARYDVPQSKEDR